MSSSIEQKRWLFITNPSMKINVTTKERKELLLSHDATIIHHGSLYEIKFKNLSGGIWEMYCEKVTYKVK